MHRKYTSTQIKSFKSIINALVFIICVILIISTIKIGLKIYNPKQKNFIKNSNFAFEKIQEEINEVYKSQKYLFKNEEDNSICEILSEKLSNSTGNCYNSSQNYSHNFTISGTNIEIWGLEKPSYKLENNLVKDFFIDTNGTKGENTFGIDRIPLRIYSTGRLGGTITPINCSRDDEKNYYFHYSPICIGSPEINYLANNIPFGFDVIQIGGKKGISNKLNRDIPYLRADCIAFGGELIAGDYCEAKGYSWLTACYYDYLCAIKLSEAKL